MGHNAPGFELPLDLATVCDPPLLAPLPDPFPPTVGTAGTPGASRRGSRDGGGGALVAARPGPGAAGPGAAARALAPAARAGEGGGTAAGAAVAGTAAAAFARSLAVGPLAPLRLLDASRCSLRGPLGVAGLERLTDLVALVLDDNALSGPLPGDRLTCLRRLEHVSLERNALTGPLPVRK